jgi:hypothetical protein
VKLEDRGAVKENASKTLLVHVNIFAKVLLAVFPTTTTGVLRRTVRKTHGNRISTMATRTTTIRVLGGVFGLCGVLNKQVYRPDKKISGRYAL